MSNVNAVAIIAEYNPFHNGHLYQISEAARLTEADYCIVIMSGHFVQRGEVAIYDSYTRARMALRAGADLVLEMPSPFSTSSAEDFASYGIALCGSLGISYISFGIEADSIDILKVIANILSNESDSYKASLNSMLKLGMSFPQARQTALLEELKTSGYPDDAITLAKDALSSPNNILAIEYLKAIYRFHSPVKPIAVTRLGSGYNDTKLNESYASASAIREFMKSGGELNNLKPYVPEEVLEIMSESKPLYSDDITDYIIFKLISDIYEGRKLSEYADISDELSMRIAATYKNLSSYDELIKAIKSKQYTYTHISRALTHILLGLTKDNMQLYKSGRLAPYARILGFRQESASLLTQLKEMSSVPIISKLADASSILDDDLPALSLLLDEVHASDIYSAAYYKKYHIELPNLYSRQLVII